MINAITTKDGLDQAQKRITDSKLYSQKQKDELMDILMARAAQIPKGKALI